MLILYTTLSCSTAGEVFLTALYCKHWSYSQGERSKLRLAQLFSTLSNLSQGPTPFCTSVLTRNMPYKNVPWARFEPTRLGARQMLWPVRHGRFWLIVKIMSAYKHCSYWLVFNNYQLSQANIYDVLLSRWCFLIALVVWCSSDCWLWLAYSTYAGADFMTSDFNSRGHCQSWLQQLFR